MPPLAVSIGRRRRDAAALALVAAGTVLLASDQGGFFPRTWPWATLAFGAVAGIALLLVEELRGSRASATLVVGLAALAGWTALSAAWSPAPHASLHEAERTLVYVAAALALAPLATPPTAALAGLLAGVTGLAGASLLDRVVRGPHPADAQGSLLEWPLGYANGLGALCALGLVLTLLLALQHRRPLLLAPAALLTPALVLTQSRGSWLALGAGLGVGGAAALGRRRAAAAVAGAVAIGLAVLSAIPAFAEPATLQARGDYWRVAWHEIVRHPLAGTGAGTFDRSWIAFGDLVRWDVTLDAHSLYLETASELGLVGLALLLAALLTPLAAGLESGAAAPALGGAVAFLVHTGLDWDWELPAVTFAGLVCLAACPPPGRRGGRRARGAALTVASALVAFSATQVLRRTGFY